MENNNEDIEASKRLKETGWFPALKEYYEPKDVIRYYDTVDEINNRPFREPLFIQPPEKFFTSEVLKEGHILLDKRNLKKLESQLHSLKNVEIPRLEEEIKVLTEKL